MRKILFALILICAFLTMISCSDEPDFSLQSGNGKVEMTFHTYELSSKTTIDGDGTVTWSAEDAICLFDGYENNKFSITGGEGTPSASFSGYAMPESEYVALYPYSKDALYADGIVTSVLSVEQTVSSDGTFGTMTNPSVAVAEGMSLRFRNIASLLMIELVNQSQERSVENIVISSDKALAGEYTVPIEAVAETYKAVPTSHSSGNVMLVPQSPGISRYCSVVFPGNYSSLNVLVNYNDGTNTNAVFRNVDLKEGAGARVIVDASVPEPIPDNSLFARYMAGEDIEVVPGMFINKDEYGNAELIDAENTSINDRNTKVYFVSPDVEATYDITSLLSVMFIVGDDPERHGKVKQNQQMLLGTPEASATGDEKFVMSNIELTTITTPQPGKSIFALKKANNSRIDYVHVHNCYIKFSGLDIFSSFNNDGRQVQSINYTDNIFEFTPYEYNSRQYPVFISQLLADIVKLDPAEVTEMNFKNNVFYNSSTDKVVNTFKALHSLTAGSVIDELTFSSNTCINAHSIPKGGFLDITHVGKLSIDKNLVWMNMAMLTNFNIAYVRNEPELTVGSNMLYKADVALSGDVVRYGESTTSEHEFVIADTDPFEGVTFPDSFNTIAGYEDFGARF